MLTLRASTSVLPWLFPLRASFTSLISAMIWSLRPVAREGGMARMRREGRGSSGAGNEKGGRMSVKPVRGWVDWERWECGLMRVNE